jgi:hypothetical protein
MKRDQAEALGVDLLELANAGAWPELVAMDLSAEALEILRRKAQLHTQISSMEQQERLLWEMLLMELVQQGAAPMAKPRANGGASDPQRQGADLARA